MSLFFASLPAKAPLSTRRRPGAGLLDANLLTGIIKVRLEKSPDSPPAPYQREAVKVIRDGRGKPTREEAEPVGETE